MNEMGFSNDLNKKVDELSLLYTDYNKNGFKMNEVVQFIVTCMMELVQVVQMYENIPNSKKYLAVMDAMEKLYMSHNPNIPWIPEPFETMLENMLLDYVVPALYKSFVK